jgi:hypothetical protein
MPDLQVETPEGGSRVSTSKGGDSGEDRAPLDIRVRTAAIAEAATRRRRSTELTA